MYKKITLVHFFAFMLATLTYAQSFEVGVFMGASNYMGDLPGKHVDYDKSSLAVGFFLKYNVTEYLSARVGYMQGRISGDDQFSEAKSGRKSRNLHFESKIKEINILAECHFLAFAFDGERPLFSPYVFGGIAGFHHNPMANINNELVALQPLGTEGQNLEGGPDKYGLYQIAIPAGFGTEIKVGSVAKIGFEIGVRKTFTDYLDDISSVYPDIEALSDADPLSASLSYRTPEYDAEYQELNPVGNIRGNSEHKDWYGFAGLSFTFNVSALGELGGGPGIYNPF